MKVLLIGKSSIVEPLGLMFLESSLREIGADVKIILFDQDPRSRELVWRSDFVGLSTFTGYHKTMFAISDHIRKETKTIIGGPHATFFADDCLKHADHVVIGEGLRSIQKICQGEAKNGKVFTPELVSGSQIPIPTRKTLYSTYRDFYKNPIKNIMASMGCPFQCNHCFNSGYDRLYKNKVVRYRSVESIIEECKELKTYPLELIFFQDDCFGAKLVWLEEFARAYKSKINIPFHCQLRPEIISIERMTLLKEAGCHGITVAIESSNDKVRRRLLNRKGLDNDGILQACALVKEFGFKLRTEQMLGLPETTIQDELNLLKMNVEIRPNIAWSSIFTPYLGTVLGDYCKKVGMYDGNNDDLEPTFFGDSKLKFEEERLRKTNQLQRIFSTCSQIVEGDKLAQDFIDKGKYDFDSWFATMRKHLYDRDLYRVNA